jgi:CBS domain-containing protein
MSPRAAWRLESLGFPEVYDYVPGKLDWLAAGLPSEGREAAKPTAGSVARTDVPTCELGDRVGDVRRKVHAAGSSTCVVVNAGRIVLGVLRQEELGAADETPASDAMQPGPSTFRPHVPIEEMAEYMRTHDLASAPVTSSDGRIVGVLYRDDAEHEAKAAR